HTERWRADGPDQTCHAAKARGIATVAWGVGDEQLGGAEPANGSAPGAYEPARMAGTEDPGVSRSNGRIPTRDRGTWCRRDPTRSANSAHRLQPAGHQLRRMPPIRRALPHRTGLATRSGNRV